MQHFTGYLRAYKSAANQIRSRYGYFENGFLPSGKFNEYSTLS